MLTEGTSRGARTLSEEAWRPPGQTTLAEGAPIAQHCSSPHGEPEQPCAGHTKPNLKQRRNVRLLAELTDIETPDLDAMTFSEADKWIGKRWRVWMERGAPLK